MKVNLKPGRAIVKKYVIVFVVRNQKNRIIYSSGRKYFFHKESMELFKYLIKDQIPDAEFHEVNINIPSEPDNSKESKGYWCPYCGNWEYWKTVDNYKRCPICNISDGEYYVKTYNKLWHKGTKDTVKDQKSKAKNNKSNKVRRKR